MTFVELNTSSTANLLLHYGIFGVTALVSLVMIHYFFYKPDASEQDQYYLRGGVTKMVKLAGKPRHIGGKYWLYKAKLANEEALLGADMQKIEINFDYVPNQEVVYDQKKSGRYPVENLGSKGFFEFIEMEGSDIDQILRRNIDAAEPFEFSIKGPLGGLKYIGKGQFFE